MCLFLYISGNQKPDAFPVTSNSKFLEVREVFEQPGNRAILKYFEPNPIWLVLTEEGCSCGFSIGDLPEKDWPDELKESALEYYKQDLERVSKLHHFCGALASKMIDKRIHLLGEWDGKDITPTIRTEHDLDYFFNPEGFELKEQHLYTLVLSDNI